MFAALLNVCGGGGIILFFAIYAIVCDALNSKSIKFHDHDYFLDVLIKCIRKIFLLTPQPWKPTGVPLTQFCADEYPVSTNYALDCTKTAKTLLYVFL